MTERLPFVCPVCRTMSRRADVGYCGTCDAVTVFRAGERVRATVIGQTFAATLQIASPNGRSLMLSFDRALLVMGGMYLGFMPVLQEDDGVYRELVDGMEVKIERDAPLGGCADGHEDPMHCPGMLPTEETGQFRCGRCGYTMSIPIARSYVVRRS